MNTADIKIPIKMQKSLKDKLDWLANYFDKEIGGWITGEVTKDGIILDDLLIPEQEVGMASVDISGKQLALMRKEYGDKCKRILGEWHSHNSMGNFFSGTDESLIEQHMGPRKTSIFIVSSKGEGHRIRFEMRKPFHISIDNLPYEVEIDNKVIKSLEKEIKKKVKEKTYSYKECGSPGIVYAGGTKNIWDFSKEGNNKPEEKSEENKIRDRIKGLVKYDDFNKIVTVEDIPWYYGESICAEFQDLKPEMIAMGLGLEAHYKVTFKMQNKQKCIELMRDLSDYLRNYFAEDMLSSYNY